MYTKDTERATNYELRNEEIELRIFKRFKFAAKGMWFRLHIKNKNRTLGASPPLTIRTGPNSSVAENVACMFGWGVIDPTNDPGGRGIVGG